MAAVEPERSVPASDLRVGVGGHANNGCREVTPRPLEPDRGKHRSRRRQIAEKVALQRGVNRLDRVEFIHGGRRLALRGEPGHGLPQLRSVKAIKRIEETLQRRVCRSLAGGWTQKVERRPDARLVKAPTPRTRRLEREKGWRNSERHRIVPVDRIKPQGPRQPVARLRHARKLPKDAGGRDHDPELFTERWGEGIVAARNAAERGGKRPAESEARTV